MNRLKFPSDGQVFDSAEAAAKSTGCNRSGVFKVLSNIAKHAHGYSFKYYEEKE